VARRDSRRAKGLEKTESSRPKRGDLADRNPADGLGEIGGEEACLGGGRARPARAGDRRSRFARDELEQLRCRQRDGRLRLTAGLEALRGERLVAVT
jgi:hypothetical protein